MVINLKLRQMTFFALPVTIALIAIVYFVRLDSQPTKEVFANQGESVLILDAGHGGEDGGAVSVYGVSESGINLDIAQKAAQLADFCGISFALTRDSEELSYPDTAGSVRARKVYDQKARVKFIESVQGGLLMSIHQNCFPSSRPFGPHVFYSKNSGSNELALIAQEYMNAALCPKNRRVAAPISRDNYLLKNISCTAVLVECGFLSNPNEATLLSTEEYRLKIATALIGTYLRYTNEL